MTFASLKAWLMQPTTVAGISTMIGTGAALAFGSISYTSAIPVLIGAAVAIALPDNTTLAPALSKTALDTIHAAASGGAAGAVEALVADAPADVAAFQAGLAAGTAAKS